MEKITQNISTNKNRTVLPVWRPITGIRVGHLPVFFIFPQDQCTTILFSNVKTFLKTVKNILRK